MVVWGFSLAGRWWFGISKSKLIFSSKPQVRLRPSLSNVQKQTSAGGFTQHVRGVGSGFATQKGDLWKVSMACLGTVPPFSCVLCQSEQRSNTVPDQKCSGTGSLVCSGREPWLCKGCPVSGLLPQMATVGAGDSPKAVLACPLLFIYLFVLFKYKKAEQVINFLHKI